MFDIIGDSR